MANHNPLLDTRAYMVQFVDGHEAVMVANQIAKNPFAQVDEDGNRFVLLNKIVNHHSGDDAIQPEDAFYMTP